MNVGLTRYLDQVPPPSPSPHARLHDPISGPILQNYGSKIMLESKHLLIDVMTRKLRAVITWKGQNVQVLDILPVSMGLAMNAGSHRRFHPEMGQFGGEKIALLSARSLSFSPSFPLFRIVSPNLLLPRHSLTPPPPPPLLLLPNNLPFSGDLSR